MNIDVIVGFMTNVTKIVVALGNIATIILAVAKFLNSKGKK